ncbi:uncharacterized protein UMAG_03652 [Mycosarcoma maydis]|uniref:Uncharacterized protein n=1 Tax=Mycosarcoma maydis TaxID=5270 RepID=A0A0D1DV14_MYCMD|nr:uncharacterized protein UMAG_03652 [Ustilago maydis 521]KIS68069.1 hypothetical protein UMAG_03652 [Ustilago maydis 521]|eukprot:XP_011390139.1 hypothetical protein UMAG_03652 [Ustilago maydis 521]
MVDLTSYLVLGVVLLPPILRRAQRLSLTMRTARHSNSLPSPPPKFFSNARLTPFASPFSTTVSMASLLFILISCRNLIPAQYGIDLFIPASIVDALRRWLHTLYPARHRSSSSSNVSDSAPIHIDAFRGGYKPDLFLAYNAPITIPTTTLRKLINQTPSLLPMGLLTPSRRAELQALIARLSSYEGRRIYLVLGPRPLLDCSFCKTTNDHFWYALAFVLASYAWRIVALGLLTTHPDDSVAVAIRQACSLLTLGRRSSSLPWRSSARGRSTEADRSTWRVSSLLVLLSLLAVELLVMLEFGQVSSEMSRWNHWHTNLDILRQLVFGALVCVIYLFPTRRVGDDFEQSVLHLDSTHQNLQNLLHISQLLQVARTVVLQDEQLLDTASQWKRSSDRSAADLGPISADKIISTATSRGGRAATDLIAQAQAGIHRVTRSWWRNAELVNRQLDQQDESTTTLSHDQSVPST